MSLGVLRIVSFFFLPPRPNRPGAVVFTLFVWLTGAHAMCQVTINKVGSIALVSTDHKFLQAHADVGDTGELHASNPNVNQEETWWLYNYGSPTDSRVLLANWRSNYYIQRHGGGATNHRAGATAHDPTPDAVWLMVPGMKFGLAPDIVAFQALDGSWLKAYAGGHNAAGEPGEVYVDMSPGPSADPNWNGWWKMGQTTNHPVPGDNIWSGIADATVGVVKFVYNVVNFAFTGNNQPANQSFTVTGLCYYHKPPQNPAVQCDNTTNQGCASLHGAFQPNTRCPFQ